MFHERITDEKKCRGWCWYSICCAVRVTWHVAPGTWRPAHPIIPCQYQNNKYTTVQTRPLLLHQASEDQDLGSKCFNCADLWFSSQLSTFTLILKTKVREDFTITEKASTRAYSRVATNSDFDRIPNTEYYSFLGIYKYRIPNNIRSWKLTNTEYYSVRENLRIPNTE